MISDIKPKDQYLNFINVSYGLLHDANVSLDNNKKKLEECIKFLTKHKDDLRIQFKVNLDDYYEWTTKEYGEQEYLHSLAVNLLQKTLKLQYRFILINLVKYTTTLYNIVKDKYNIKLYTHCKNMNTVTYNKLTKGYYNEVAKVALTGDGYKFKGGIGVYCIHYWKLDESKVKKKILDKKASNAKKQELIDKGLTPYNKLEHDKALALGIPYNGIDYRVFRNDSFYYEFDVCQSKEFSSKMIQFHKTDYIHPENRGITWQELCDTRIKTYDDIHNCKVDVKIKLNFLLRKGYVTHLNFVRNINMKRHEPGAHRTNKKTNFNIF